jgi:hypothetical protein
MSTESNGVLWLICSFPGAWACLQRVHRWCADNVERVARSAARCVGSVGFYSCMVLSEGGKFRGGAGPLVFLATLFLRLLVVWAYDGGV